MKVHVLFDDAGHIHAISHPVPRKGAKTAKGAKPGTLGGFRPHASQHMATVEVPAEAAGLTHDSVRIEHRAGQPHLVAKTK